MAKIKKLAGATGLRKAAAVETAVDPLLPKHRPYESDDVEARLDATLVQMDRIPDVAGPFDPLEWDENGLPQ